MGLGNKRTTLSLTTYPPLPIHRVAAAHVRIAQLGLESRCGKRRPPSQRRPVVARVVVAVPRWQPPPGTAVVTAAYPPVGATRGRRGHHLPPLGRRQSAGSRGACGRPLPTCGRVPFRRQRLPLVRAAVDAAAAVGGAPSAPASGGHVGDRHHRRHGRLPRLMFSDLPLVRALPWAPVGNRCSHSQHIFRRMKTVALFCKSVVFSRARF